MNAPALSFASALFPLFACIAFLASPSHCGAVAGNAPQPERPSITQQPVSASIEQGQTATFTVTATAFPSPGYQWLKNGTHLKDATTAKLTLTNVQSSTAGSYTVVVSNKYGHADSKAATLTVISTVIPIILAQPVSIAMSEGQTATFEVTAAASPGLSYRWRKHGAFIAGATAARLTLANLQPSDAAEYDVVITNTRGAIISRGATLTVLRASAVVQPRSATRIVAQPASAALIADERATLTVDATGDQLTYQWKKNGRDISGATSANLTIARATASDMGFYSVAVDGADGAVESNAAIITVASGGASRLGNLSTRGLVPANGALTVGFTLRGSGPKQLLARAVGPTLVRFGVEGALGDPQLQIIPAGAVTPLLSNDDWSGINATPGLARATAAVGAFALDEGSKDAALLASLNTATHLNYTARITSADPRASGTILAEIYDSDPTAAPVRLAGISTLAFAGLGEHALVLGFTIDGAAPKRLLIRAVGPGLETFGVTGLLADPRLTVVPSGLNRAIAANDDWAADGALVNAFSAAGAFPLDRGSKDAALVVSLPPGGYTVTVSGAGGTTGATLLEIYDLDP